MNLARVLEPEVMDTLDEAEAYDAMDHREVNQRFVSDLLARTTVGGTILDLGTGSALIPIEFCRQQPKARIVAVDLAESMLNVARKNVAVAGYDDRVQLQKVDAKSLPYDSGQFDLIMSNSIIHHIPQPAGVMAEAVRVAGRALFFRDLMRPGSENALDELVTTYAGDETQHAQTMFRDSLHAALALDEIRAIVVALGFSPETVQATSDRHWTWFAEMAERN